jgi:hypothetical protein
MEGNVGVSVESLIAALSGATMARPGPKGNRGPRLFPRVLREAFKAGL